MKERKIDCFTVIIKNITSLCKFQFASLMSPAFILVLSALIINSSTASAVQWMTPIDNQGNYYYYVESQNHGHPNKDIIKVDSSGQETNVFSWHGTAAQTGDGLAYDNTRDLLYATKYNQKTIFAIDPNTGTHSSFNLGATNSSHYYGLAVDDNGMLYAAGAGWGVLRTEIYDINNLFDANNNIVGSASHVANLDRDSTEIHVRRDGSTAYIKSSENKIYEWDLSTRQEVASYVVPGPYPVTPRAMALGSNNSILYKTGDHKVYQLDDLSATPSLVGDAPVDNSVRGMTVDASGTIKYMDRSSLTNDHIARTVIAAVDSRGFVTATGIHQTTGSAYDAQGYDINGHNSNGFDSSGTHKNGTDYDDNGFNMAGWSAGGVFRDGKQAQNGSIANDFAVNHSVARESYFKSTVKTAQIDVTPMKETNLGEFHVRNNTRDGYEVTLSSAKGGVLEPTGSSASRLDGEVDIPYTIKLSKSGQIGVGIDTVMVFESNALANAVTGVDAVHIIRSAGVPGSSAITSATDAIFQMNVKMESNTDALGMAGTYADVLTLTYKDL